MDFAICLDYYNFRVTATGVNSFNGAHLIRVTDIMETEKNIFTALLTMTDYVPKVTYFQRRVAWVAVWSMDFLDVIWASTVFTLCVTKLYATVQANEQISNSLRLPLGGQRFLESHDLMKVASLATDPFFRTVNYIQV